MDNRDFMDSLLIVIKIGAGVGAGLGVMLTMLFSGKVFIRKLGFVGPGPDVSGFEAIISALRDNVAAELREQTAALKQEISATEGRLGMRLDRVENRLDTRITGVESRLDATMRRGAR